MNKKRKKHISLLLGAGFSANKGYPLGSVINDGLKNMDRKNSYFTDDGKLFVDESDLGTNSRQEDYDYGIWDRAYQLCLDLIPYYISNIKRKGQFNYEEYYDYLFFDAIDDTEAKKYTVEQYIKNLNLNYINDELQQAIETIKLNFEKEYSNLISLICNNIYNQLVMFLLKDENGFNYYNITDSTSDNFTGFLNYLSKIDRKYFVDIHTLNHDLLFESFNNTPFFEKEKIYDGFSLQDSIYYCHNQQNIPCQLERYKEKFYNTRFRLYKLHGSINYRRYYHPHKNPDVNSNYSTVHLPVEYVKQQYGCEDFIYRKEGQELKYMSTTDFHGDILTGTTAKILRYNEPLLYKKLLNKFAYNLNKSEMLIICGYGAGDTEINKIIKQNFAYNKKPVFVINPKAQDLSELDTFFANINSKLITTSLKDISKSDFKLKK
jgi:hypothetical protein